MPTSDLVQFIVQLVVGLQQKPTVHALELEILKSAVAFVKTLESGLPALEKMVIDMVLSFAVPALEAKLA